MSRRYVMSNGTFRGFSSQMRNRSVPHHIFYRHNVIVILPPEGTLDELNRWIPDWKMIEGPVPLTPSIEEFHKFVRSKLDDAGWTTNYDDLEGR